MMAALPVLDDCRSGFAAINAPLPTWRLITWNVLWRGPVWLVIEHGL